MEWTSRLVISDVSLVGMRTKIEIKHWITGTVLFEFETENNTLARTIREANLRGVDLREANLYGANLNEANLRGVDLYGATLREANLNEANLRGVDLYGVDLYGANLYGADLRGAKNAELVQAQTLIVPDGSLIGWKKCKDNILVKLRIPEEAKRSNATGRKCRAEFAKVVEIIDLSDKRNKPTEAYSKYNNMFVYREGETVRPDKWNEDRFEECAGGIHFFITKTEAENYNE